MGEAELGHNDTMWRGTFKAKWKDVMIGQAKS